VISVVGEWTQRCFELDAQDESHPELFALFDKGQTHIASSLRSAASAAYPERSSNRNLEPKCSLARQIFWRLQAVGQLADLVQLLSGPSIQTRHFEALSATLSQEVTRSTTVLELESLDIRQHDELVRCISQVAQEEAVQKRLLSDCLTWWDAAHLPLTPRIVRRPRQPFTKAGGELTRKTSRERWQLVAKYVFTSPIWCGPSFGGWVGGCVCVCVCALL
jgi:hypothetical protein